MRNQTLLHDWNLETSGIPLNPARTLRNLHNPVITKEKVLVVEDDAALCMGMAEHLEARGFDVACVGDGVSAIERLMEEDFDVILLDLGIPRMSGHKFLHELRREPEIPRIPVVLLTGSDPERVERAARHGVFAIHHKPSKARDIAHSLRTAVYYG